MTFQIAAVTKMTCRFVWWPQIQHLFVTYVDTHFVLYVQLNLALGMTHPWETSKYEKKIGLAWTFFIIMKENAFSRSLLETHVHWMSFTSYILNTLHFIIYKFSKKYWKIVWRKCICKTHYKFYFIFFEERRKNLEIY